jgi:NAD(P)-dependent dehydrogenase (short-subunit alcohol dehydrogenase family)
VPQAAYAASKSGLIGLTRELAQQWTGRKRIRVNALAPGYFDSEMTGQFPDDYIERTVLPRTLEGRLGHAAELSAALIFLASDAGSDTTGITLPVEGGILTS